RLGFRRVGVGRFRFVGADDDLAADGERFEDEVETPAVFVRPRGADFEVAGRGLAAVLIVAGDKGEVGRFLAGRPDGSPSLMGCTIAADAKAVTPPLKGEWEALHRRLRRPQIARTSALFQRNVLCRFWGLPIRPRWRRHRS